MVATKKTPAKTTKRKPAARKPSPSTAARMKTVSRKKVQPMRTLHVTKDDSDFVSLRFTKQTLYWCIISIAVLGLGIWVAVLNYQIQSIYDKIDASTSSNVDYMDYKHIDRAKK